MGAHAALIMTDWESIINIPFSEYKKLMKTPIIFDCCRALDYEKAKVLDIKYIGIGLG